MEPSVAIIIWGVNRKFRFLKLENAYFGLFLIKNEKYKDGFLKEMKSLPYKSAFIFAQKCMGGKL